MCSGVSFMCIFGAVANMVVSSQYQCHRFPGKTVLKRSILLWVKHKIPPIHSLNVTTYTNLLLPVQPLVRYSVQ